jgi:hypothetical protein
MVGALIQIYPMPNILVPEVLVPEVLPWLLALFLVHHDNVWCTIVTQT